MMRQTAEAKYLGALRTSLLLRLLATGCGASLAGFLSAYSSPLNVNYEIDLRSPASELVAGLLVGLLGGFVILPALIARDARAGLNEERARKMLVYLITNLLGAVALFLLGAGLYRLYSG